MAPKLSPSQHEKLQGTIRAGLPNRAVAKIVNCSERTVSESRLKMRLFGATKAPPTRVGRRSKIDPLMQDALFEQLIEEPNMFRSEMVSFLRNKFGVEVSL